MKDLTGIRRGHSYYEATARSRIAGMLDAGSFCEFLGPEERQTSPHLEALGQPCAFDDGIVVGSGSLDGQEVLIAGQEGGFMGGAVGEVHGAKLTGLLERALKDKPAAVLLLLESGGVRLHEANAGLLGISEVLRAQLAVRFAGIPVIGLIGGACGCFGGMGIVARCCDGLIMSEEGRLGLSGPDVIETTMGVEEFDASDRALVWRTVGGKHRYLLGEATRLVEDDITNFRAAAIALMTKSRTLTLATLRQEQQVLRRRLDNFSSCRDGIEVWQRMGINEPQRLPLIEVTEFLEVVSGGDYGRNR